MLSISFADIECPEFDISDVHLESRMDGRKIGARVHFSCPRGFDLKGQNGLICQKNGNVKTELGTLFRTIVTRDVL